MATHTDHALTVPGITNYTMTNWGGGGEKLKILKNITIFRKKKKNE
jgi:hypothetical protein